MFRLLSIILILSIISYGTEAVRRRKYTLTVSYARNSTSIVLINNRFPAPLIQARLNDILVIRVINKLPNDEEVTIHFHGMLQRKTPQMDGVPYITQMPIPTNRTYTHVFRAYPAGTYFYHSHSDLHAVTAFGPLVIHDRQKRGQWYELPNGPLLFSDQWLFYDRRDKEAGLLGSPFKWAGDQTALLINGRRDLVLTLEPNKKYLVRLIGATSLSIIVFAIDQHPMTVVEVDGTAVIPKERLTSIEITPGQRYAVTIETKNQTSGVFQMKAAIRWQSLPVNTR
jgi:L-ascorbate oxidase